MQLNLKRIVWWRKCITVTKNKAASDYAMLATSQSSVFLWGMVKHGTRKKSRQLDLNNKTKLVELYNNNSFFVYKYIKTVVPLPIITCKYQSIIGVSMVCTK